MAFDRRSRRELREAQESQEGGGDGGDDSTPTPASADSGTSEPDHAEQDHNEDDDTRIASRASITPTGEVDDATRIAWRGARESSWDGGADAEQDDATQLSARTFVGPGDDASEETRLASRSRDGGGSEGDRDGQADGESHADRDTGPDADATRFAAPRGVDHGPASTRTSRVRGPGELPQGVVPGAVSRGTFGETDTAYEPRRLSMPPEEFQSSGEQFDSPPRDADRDDEGPTLLTPAEAVHRRAAARRQRLIVAMAAVALVAAGVTLAVLGIVFLVGWA